MMYLITPEQKAKIESALQQSSSYEQSFMSEGDNLSLEALELLKSLPPCEAKAWYMNNDSRSYLRLVYAKSIYESLLEQGYKITGYLYSTMVENEN